LSFVFYLCCSSAEEILPGAEEEVPIIKPFKKGEPLPKEWKNKWPFDGAVLNNSAMAKILVEKDFLQQECNLRIEYSIDKTQARCDLLLEDANIHINAIETKYNEVLDVKNSEIERLDEMVVKSMDIDDYTVFWFAGGVVLGSLLTLGIVYLVSPAF